MIANYHTHTARCGHARGEDREYVLRAVERGLGTLGFSEHIPMPFEDGHESRYRMPLAQLEDYVLSVLRLREEFRGQIRILLGFEAEYYPDYFDRMLDLIRPYPVDYLILGQHFNDSAERQYNARPFDDGALLPVYVDRVLEALATGRFLYVAHPDLPCYTGKDSALYIREMRRLCEGVKALGVPLELNMLGIREGRNYPSPVFWEIASSAGCRTVLGCDAHSPDAVADPAELETALAFATRFGLTPEEQFF